MKEIFVVCRRIREDDGANIYFDLDNDRFFLSFNEAEQFAQEEYDAFSYQVIKLFLK